MTTVAALGLDIGRKRIGVAGCDRLGLLATALTTIERTTLEEDLAAIGHWVEQRQIEILVVGLPYAMDGTIGKQAKHTQKFARKLEAAFNLPLAYVDERLTSVEAETQLKAAKQYDRQQKGLVDQRAAQIILQQWLEARRVAVMP
ncbi:YqgFc, likely ribonuclease with RNase H fold [[Synechococcus] sp. NIES-970]|uniref:Holliday junction resolvase RuvX n=1 Tax=Picosynechococcus sp. NKBG15041c TaxID=1407650 RepID=UPI00040E024E|nr:Holliday junction resolvase RuvX [Picosynechococcus sp. NKBG15041c]BAW96189.1 YqgFc, likely ribonuclease with RNase H fold [[Synechococcus] sp. NIES-970]